jgi:hypothetical protein
MSDLSEDVFAISPNIRYVAVAHGQQVQMRSRPDLRNASSSDSYLYEELLVNPTLLTLATRRGNIDCGGLRYLIIGYGHLHQLVVPVLAVTCPSLSSSAPTRPITSRRSWVCWHVTADPARPRCRTRTRRTQMRRSAAAD